MCTIPTFIINIRTDASLEVHLRDVKDPLTLLRASLEMQEAAAGGYFPVGDVARSVELTQRLSDDKAFHAALTRQCAQRAPLFAPEAEMHAVQALPGEMMRLA